MYETVTQDFDIKRGETWQAAFQFSIDLTGYIVNLSVGGGDVMLTDGAGLTITRGPNSVVEAELSRAQTSKFEGNQHWYLELIQPDGRGGYPMDGTFNVSSP